MKIVQQKVIGRGVSGGYSTSIVYDVARSLWYPLRFTGVQAIYFEFWGQVSAAGTEGDVVLYDHTNGAVIATIHLDSATPALQKSADISAYLMAHGNIELGLYYQRTAGAGYLAVCTAHITVEQDDAQASRKTETVLTGMSFSSGATGTAWYYYPLYYVMLHNDQADGIVQCYAQVYGRASVGGVAYFRVYDVTTSEAVPNSEMQTNSVANTWLISGELALIGGHKYTIQGRADADGKHATWDVGNIAIVQAGFNKCVSIPCALPSSNSGTDQTTYPGGVSSFEPTKISGADGLTYRYDIGYNNDSFFSGTDTVKLQNITAGTTVGGTEHTIAFSAYASYFYEDTPTMPVADVEIGAARSGTGRLNGKSPGVICFQQENLTPGSYLSPDPTMPTGYHCFMSQFIRNMFAGYIPRRTPDGVNPCWA